MKYAITIILLSILSCTPAATVDDKAGELIRAEVEKNSMGVIRGETIDMEIEWENDTTCRADYRFELPRHPGRWRTVNMRYVFDREISKIVEKEML